MVIPHQRLAPDTLESILESFINREGTDYGEQELSLNAKVAGLKKLILKGDVSIVFDEKTDSLNLIDSKELKQLLVV